MERATVLDKLERVVHPPVLTAREFGRISTLMHERFGVDLRTGKEGLVAARLGKKLRQGGFTTFGAYFESVLADASGGSLIEMVDALTTNHTSFMREQAHFDFLTGTIAPSVPAASTLQIWSAASSTGEEPYSIACALLAAPGLANRKFQILATDLSARALEKAKAAVYPAERFQDFPAPWRQSFLVKTADGAFRIKPEVAGRVEFRRLNLVEPITHGRRFHVIFCRNVMIYFDRPTQESLVQRLGSCLEPGGYLFVGHSETLTGLDHRLEYIKPAIYRNGKAKSSRSGT
jgi:chemotaxis protein methyltransferase CheR